MSTSEGPTPKVEEAQRPAQENSVDLEFSPFLPSEAAEKIDEQMDERSTSERSVRPLMFSITKGKRDPDGYISLDRALDRLGRKQKPEEWGRSPCWRDMPFRWNSEKRGYYKTIIRGRGKNKKRVPKRVSEEFSIEDVRNVARIYKETYSILALAFEKKLVKTAVLHHNGDVVPVPKSSIWISQSAPIFFSGIIEDNDEICRVFVEKSSFEKWLNPPISPKPSDDDVSRLLAIKKLLEDWGKEMTIIKDPLITFLEVVFKDTNADRLEPYIEKYIWQTLSIKNTSGPRVIAFQAAFNEAIKGQLRTDIVAELKRPVKSVPQEAPPVHSEVTADDDQSANH